MAVLHFSQTQVYQILLSVSLGNDCTFSASTLQVSKKMKGAQALRAPNVPRVSLDFQFLLKQC